MKSQCGVPDCASPARTRGWCSKHYARWRKHGDPLKTTGAAHGEPGDFLSMAALYCGEACLIWPYARMKYGYGKIRIGRRVELVHRQICIAAHGPPPTESHQAAHSCGKGHKGCCNPNHLRWATPKENQADCLIHGTRPRGESHGRSKLTEADVYEIRRLLTTALLQKDIATKLSISFATVSSIKLGRYWSHLLPLPEKE